MGYWKHQENGIRFVRNKDGAMLWWGMGSGKSYASIGIVKDQKAQTVLVVCPKSVVPTWIKEFAKHTNNEFTIIAPMKGSVAKKAKEIEKKLNFKRDKKPKVVILNYESIWRPGLGHTYDKWKNLTDKGLIRRIDWDIVFVDECQKIKSAGSKVSLFFKLLRPKAKKRIALSGTPTPNAPVDIYGIFRFLDPSIFGTSYQRFRMRYCEMGGFEMRKIVRYIDQDQFNKKVYSISDKVETEDVVELPEFVDITVECDLSPKARKAYNEFHKEAVLEFASGTELTAQNILVKQLRLSQMTSGIIKDDDGVEHIIDTSKLDILEDLLLSIDEPCVIFTRFRSEVTQIRAMIEKFPRKGERERIVCQIASQIDERDKFESGEAEICIVNIASGGTGLNELVRARYCFYYSTGYSNGDYLQSKGRVRRPGSDVTKKVLYYHIVARDTMDEVIRKAIENKLNIIETVLADFSKHVSRKTPKQIIKKAA